MPRVFFMIHSVPAQALLHSIRQEASNAGWHT